MKRICDGLDVSIEDFVRPGKKNVVSGRKALTREGQGDFFTSGQYDYRAHANEISNKSMVPLELRVRARKVSEFDHWSQHRGEEFVYVLSGTLEIHTEHYAPFRLEKGESAYFRQQHAPRLSLGQQGRRPGAVGVARPRHRPSTSPSS